MNLNYPQIIGITGRKFNGKDTLGNFLIEKKGYKRIAFADALKDACKCIFGLTDEQLYGNLKEVEDPFWKTTPRKILQFVGTDLFRENLMKIMPWIDKNIWIEVVKKKILDEIEIDPNVKIVVTDVRFDNEINLIKELHGLTLRVVRPDINNNLDLHQSEIEIDRLDVNYEILNNGTLEELYSKIENLLNNNTFNMLG